MGYVKLERAVGKKERLISVKLENLKKDNLVIIYYYYYY